VDNRSEYLTALREADKDNLRPFVDFIFSRSIATFVSVRPRHLDVPEVSGADTDLRGEPPILGEPLREAPGQQISKAVVRVVGDALKHEAQIRHPHGIPVGACEVLAPCASALGSRKVRDARTRRRRS